MKTKTQFGEREKMWVKSCGNIAYFVALDQWERLLNGKGTVGISDRKLQVETEKLAS